MEDISKNVNLLEAKLKGLLSYIREDMEPSDRLELESVFRKYYLISIASYFETLVIESLHDILETSRIEALKNFINNKSLKRQYHTLFKWDGTEINQFLGLFGDIVKSHIVKVRKEDAEFNQGMIDFLYLGNLRNELVHKRLAEYSTDITFDEINIKFSKAFHFANKLFSEIEKVKSTE